MDLAQVAPPPTGLHRRAARDRARQTDVGCANDRKAGIAAVRAKATDARLASPRRTVTGLEANGRFTSTPAVRFLGTKVAAGSS